MVKWEEPNEDAGRSVGVMKRSVGRLVAKQKGIEESELAAV